MIGHYLHHHGSGHRRRGTAIARELRTPVVGLGSGGAPGGWPGAWLELARDDDPTVDDPGLADVSAGGVLHWVPRHHPGLLERHRELVAWLARDRPALVVVDVSVEVALVVRLCGIPVVVGGMPGGRTDEVHRLAYDLAEAILAPWPEAAHPDAGWAPTWEEKAWHVGGISALQPHAPQEASPVERATGEGRGDVQERTQPRTGREILLLWGQGSGDLPAEDLAMAREATPGWTWTLRDGAHPASDDAALAAELAAADVVVCHAGQGAVADVAAARRPAVVLAQPRPYDEQVATARALQRMGLAACDLGWPPAHRWPELLEQAQTLGGDGWTAWGSDGAVCAARHLDSLVERVGR